MRNGRRVLAGAPSASRSTVQGLTTIYVNIPTTISVKLFDSSGNFASLLSTQVLFVQISNESTKGANFNLIPVDGRQIVLDKEIFGQMILTNDGTYQYNFTITKVGKITISVLLYTQGGFFIEHFDNMDFKGNNTLNRTETMPYLQFNWGSNLINYKGNNYVSFRLNFLIKPPPNRTVNFQINVDDFVHFYIENNIVVSNKD